MPTSTISINTVSRAVFSKKNFAQASAEFRPQSQLEKDNELLLDISLGVVTLAIYPLIKYLYRALTDESKMKAKAQGIAPLEQALLLAEPDATSITFDIENKEYTIKEDYTERHVKFLGIIEVDSTTGKTTRRRLDLRHAEETEFDQHFEAYTSIRELRHKSVLVSCFDQLSREAKETFRSNFILPTENLQCTPTPAPLLIENTEGSTARQILMGIQAGMIAITTIGVTLLTELLKHEALTRHQIEQQNQTDLEKSAILTKFQSSKELQGKLTLLNKELRVKDGHTRLIHLGNHIHGRYAIDKDIDRSLREQLHAHGAIFIAGPQDCYTKAMFDDPTRFGMDAKDTLPQEVEAEQGQNSKEDIDLEIPLANQWDLHQRKVLSNVYYDEKTNTLYSHHGVAAYKKGDVIPDTFGHDNTDDHGQNQQFSVDTIECAFGTLTAQQFNVSKLRHLPPKKLTEAINKLALPPYKYDPIICLNNELFEFSAGLVNQSILDTNTKINQVYNSGTFNSNMTELPADYDLWADSQPISANNQFKVDFNNADWNSEFETME